ncbi:MAG: ABC transporter ATP-binding protein [Planctomycetota bacterium]
MTPGTDSNSPLLELEGVTFAYGRGPRVVGDVDLTLRPAEVHALLGDSGSGKSTLLRLIAGLERPDAGRIVLGDDVLDDGPRRNVPPERRPVGMVFQDFALFPHLTVRRNVAFGMGRRPDARAEADRLLGRVGMTGFGDAMPHTLSGGQQQRVAVARAMGQEPRVMLLDEPFSGLDATLRDRVRAETLAVLRDAGVAVLMVTHDPREAVQSADTMSIMRGGRITRRGTPGELCRKRRVETAGPNGEVGFDCIELIDG